MQNAKNGQNAAHISQVHSILIMYCIAILYTILDKLMWRPHEKEMQFNFHSTSKWPTMASPKPSKKHQIGNFGQFLTLRIGILIVRILFSTWQQSSYISAFFTEVKNPWVS
jgi:hypothetical protein